MKKIRLFLLSGICLIAMLFSTQSEAVNVTFRVDMQYQTVPPEGVHIAGNFQGWNPGSTAMTLTTGAIYTYTYAATSGEITLIRNILTAIPGVKMRVSLASVIPTVTGF